MLLAPCSTDHSSILLEIWKSSSLPASRRCSSTRPLPRPTLEGAATSGSAVSCRGPRSSRAPASSEPWSEPLSLLLSLLLSERFSEPCSWLESVSPSFVRR